MELIQIVDEQGNDTGQIMDKEEAHDKNLLHNEVATFVINHKGQVLLQKRSVNKRFNPNKWALCAGHVDVGESLEEAALRELEEELGISVLKKELHAFSKKEVTKAEINSHITYFYYVRSDKKETEYSIQKEELSEVKWFTIDDVVEMIREKDTTIVFKENRLPVFEDLKKMINK